LVAPRKRALCPQLDQLYPQLDEPANKEIHFQALNFKNVICRNLYLIIKKFSKAEIQLKKLPIALLRIIQGQLKILCNKYIML